MKDVKKIDIALPLLHGLGGEDGRIQGFLESLNLVYLGSGVETSAIAMNKFLSYLIFKFNRLKVPNFQIINRNNLENIRLPAMIKPARSGSSIGLYLVKKQNQIYKAYKDAKKYDKLVLAEDYIKGRELTCGVFGGKYLKSLPVVEIIPPSDFFNYKVKYNGSTQEIVPARLDKKLSNKVQNIAIKAHRVLGCFDLSRTDMILDKKGEIFVLELNTTPGLTSQSLIPKAVKAFGISFETFLNQLIEIKLKEG